MLNVLEILNESDHDHLEEQALVSLVLDKWDQETWDYQEELRTREREDRGERGREGREGERERREKGGRGLSGGRGEGVKGCMCVSTKYSNYKMPLPYTSFII